MSNDGTGSVSGGGVDHFQSDKAEGKAYVLYKNVGKSVAENEKFSKMSEGGEPPVPRWMSVPWLKTAPGASSAAGAESSIFGGGVWILAGAGRSRVNVCSGGRIPSSWCEVPTGLGEVVAGAKFGIAATDEWLLRSGFDGILYKQFRLQYRPWSIASCALRDDEDTVLVAVAGAGGVTVHRLSSISTVELVAVLHTGQPIGCVSFSDDGSVLVVAALAGNIGFWSGTEYTPAQLWSDIVNTDKMRCTALSFRAVDGVVNACAAGYSDGSVMLWRTADDGWIRHGLVCPPSAAAGDDDIERCVHLAWSSNGRWLVIGGGPGGGGVNVLDSLNHWEVICSIPSSKSKQIRGLCALSDGFGWCAIVEAAGGGGGPAALVTVPWEKEPSSSITILPGGHGVQLVVKNLVFVFPRGVPGAVSACARRSGDTFEVFSFHQDGCLRTWDTLSGAQIGQHVSLGLINSFGVNEPVDMAVSDGDDGLSVQVVLWLPGRGQLWLCSQPGTPSQECLLCPGGDHVSVTASLESVSLGGARLINRGVGAVVCWVPLPLPSSSKLTR